VFVIGLLEGMKMSLGIPSVSVDSAQEGVLELGIFDHFFC
jgi:hypothetical protein